MNEIILSRFIDVYLGDTDKVVREGTCSKEEQEEAAARLCMQYVSIVGGRSVLAQISRRNEMLGLQMRLVCLGACRRLARLGRWDNVHGILLELGYRFDGKDCGGMLRKVDSVEASCKYRLERMRISDGAHKAGASKPGRDYFTRERVAVMAHMKMHIDPDVFTAAEYAWMVRRMCDELQQVMNKTQAGKVRK